MTHAENPEQLHALVSALGDLPALASVESSRPCTTGNTPSGVEFSGTLDTQRHGDRSIAVDRQPVQTG